jgi:iron complex transport system permease protein
MVCLTGFSFVAALSVGAVDIEFLQVISAITSSSQQPSDLVQSIVWELRLPRSLLAFFAGAGLALAGACLQMITRNPLADPYLFGISSGASFGVVVAMSLFGGALGFILPVAAFAGSLFAIVLLLVIAGLNRTQQVESMLLAGVALSFLFSAFTSLFLYWSDPQAVTAILFWTLGSFARADWQNIWLPLFMVMTCFGLMLLFQRQLSALLLGDESATTLGIKVKQLRVTMLLASSLLTASIVAVSGGIGFVGLMIPHIVRFFISQGSRWNFVFTAITGGIFMLWVDVASRTILHNQELPIGIITSAIGSMFFLSLLYLKTKKALN